MNKIDEQLNEILSKVFIIENQINKAERTFEVWYKGEITPLKQAIKTLIAERERLARIDELNRISADPGEVIPYKHDSFAMGMNFYQSRITDRIAELTKQEEQWK